MSASLVNATVPAMRPLVECATMAAIRTALVPTVAILAALTVCGCVLLNPNRQLQTRDRPIRLIAPSPAVDSLLSRQRIQDEEAERFWREPHSKEEGIQGVEELHPGRASSYLRLLETSKVKCSKPLFTTTFIKVRVTRGPLVDRVGWVCEDDVFRTVAMP